MASTKSKMLKVAPAAAYYGLIAHGFDKGDNFKCCARARIFNPHITGVRGSSRIGVFRKAVCTLECRCGKSIDKSKIIL